MVSVSVIMAVSEDNYTESIDSALNQSLDDIEVICIDDDGIVNVDDPAVNVIRQDDDIDDVKGEYLYFLNPKDILEPDTLKKAYNQAKKDNLDFIQITDDDKMVGETHQFLILRGKTFQMDMSRYTKLFRTDFVRNVKDINSNDYLFFWECALNAKRFGFINLNQQFHAKRPDFEESINLIGATNEVFTKFTDCGYIGQFKFVLFDWRIEVLYDAFAGLKDDEREEYYNLLKEDFTQMVYHWRFADFAEYARPINYLFFKDIVYSRDNEEFERLMVQYDLELDSERIRKENEIIEKNIAIFEKENKLITSSTSWKVTKPLRGLK